jgi:uncharacterized protein involved in exopolysaccharide biosynthesis
MTEPEKLGDREISLFLLGSMLVRSRWRILRWMVIGGAVAVLPVLGRPLLYSASASFMPQGPEAGRSGLASLAGQFGLALSSSSQPESPDFYSALLKSRVLLAPISRDTFVVQEMNGSRVPFEELFKIEGGAAKRREERGVKLLQTMITTSVASSTGLVQLSVASKWPSVSLAIAVALVDGVNNFNQRTRQGQAAAERKFVEGRLAVAGDDLRSAEDRLESFLRTNRQFLSSPELTFQHDRLVRDVALKQQVFTTLTQSYEDARIREVRDTPVITVVESPSVPTMPLARGRAKVGVLGVLLGGSACVFWVLFLDMLARKKEVADAAALEFLGAVGEVRIELLDRLRWLRERAVPGTRR